MNDQNSNKTYEEKRAMDQAALIAFIEKIIEERKDPNVNDQNREQVKAVLLKELNEDINLHLIKLLPEKGQLALNDLLDKNPSDEELNKFFMDNIPNLEEELAAALLNFRAAYLLPVMQNEPQESTPQVEAAPPADISEIPPPPPPAPVAPAMDKKMN